ncbi:MULTISPECIES: hypothetical protein [unclassified Pseudoalteromonas]|uniref:hypothetical protein n=1 Tax=Pseudoalteromonas sp. RB2-MNA-CIBAN-0110 TaxID=3140439 RepID=UPI0003FD0A93|nr:hypothetical protein [Pseudoalteromonas sp. TB13]
MSEIKELVLSDKLFSLYQSFYSIIPTRKQVLVYEKLLNKVSFPIETNALQIINCKEKHNLPEHIYDDLIAPLLSAGNYDSLEALSQSTYYKLILTTNDEHKAFPYFNINKDDIDKIYSISCEINGSRDYLIAYLKSLLSNAKKVLIQDMYLSYHDCIAPNLFSLLPSSPLNIEFVQNYNDDGKTNSDIFSDRSLMHADWSVIRNNEPKFQTCHDRYLIIDDKIEVMLSSGFYYLWNKNKEISCTIKRYLNSSS